MHERLYYNSHTVWVLCHQVTGTDMTWENRGYRSLSGLMSCQFQCQFLADLVTFTGEILNSKLLFLCSESTLLTYSYPS